MSGWTTHTGTAVVLDLENVDTDQLIPARFMSTPRAEGYGRFLLHDLRMDASGRCEPDFPLNRVPHASVLVTRRNFGSGSSREAAVYALIDFGIRAVIAPSFGDIFSANAVNNGLLPARLSTDAVDAMISCIACEGATARIDLSTQTVVVGTVRAAFELDSVRREKLINGWDDIDLTRQYQAEIAAYRAERSRLQSWVFPAEGTAG